MLKTSLMVTLLLTQTFSSPTASANVFSLTKKYKDQSTTVRDVFSGIKFTYLDREDRLLILKSFLKSTELEYAPLPLKEKRIGIDFNKIKADAIAIESEVGDVLISSVDRKNSDERERISFLQAKSNMEFLDRMQLLVAKFQDTHFGIYEKIPRPFIYNGIRLFRVQGKVIVGSLENKLLGMISKISGSDMSAIKIGDEVISIDGIPVEQKVNELKAFIAGSSEEFRDSEAVRSLTLRNFKYEQKNFMRIHFRNAGLYKLPIFANSSMLSTPRPDAIAYFNKFNIPSDSTSIGITFDKETNKWTDSRLNFEGYRVSKIQANLKGMVEYNDDSGAVGMRTGYYINKGKTYGVLQLLTFSTRNLKAGNTALPFLDAVRNFIIELKENEVPLIFDLRTNGGGNGNFPAAILGMLAEEGVVYPGATAGMRFTHYMRQLQEPFMAQVFNAEDENSFLTSDEFNQMFELAIDHRLDYSPMYAASVIPYDAKVKGFKNPIVALVTADCISACDKMSFLLKESKRAKIIGTHSNGTGAGYLSTSDLNTQWQDPLKVLSTNIPNYLFGLPGKNFERNIFEWNSVETMCTENMPTFADIPYSLSMIDLTRNNLGWLQKAAQVLEEINTPQ